MRYCKIKGLQKERREMNTVIVRWWDGYIEVFETTEVRFGCDLLWMRLTNGEIKRHSPTQGCFSLGMIGKAAGAFFIATKGQNLTPDGV